MTTMTADDLRATLNLIFQPAIVHDERLLARVWTHSASTLASYGVTERRLRNAAAKVNVDPALIERLIAAVESYRHAPKCEWFALCDYPAIGTVAHPVLGDVPVCGRCADKLDLVVRPNV